MNRPKPIFIAAIVAGAILLLLLIVLFVRGMSGNQDRLSDEEEVETAAVQEPAERCSSQRTYELMKRELFRQAARIRGSDQAAFDQIATHAAVRMERPVLRSEDEALRAVGCSGLLVLDLPPGVSVVGGRRSLSAEINYLIQPAADGSGDVVMLDGADPIIVPLATLARIGSTTPEPETETPPDDALQQLNELTPGPQVEPAPPAPQQPQPAQPQTAPTASAGPSFNCNLARTRGERAVCSDPRLAALDRQMASQFNRALSNADARQRQLLESTRDRFLRYRDGCRSDDCVADSYRGRIREIADIMAGRWRAPR